MVWCIDASGYWPVAPARPRPAARLAHRLLLVLLLCLPCCVSAPARSPSSLRRDRLRPLPTPYETLATWMTCCDIRLKQIKHLEHTLATCVRSHYNICNIQIKHLQHTLETAETFGIYTLQHTRITIVTMQHLDLLLQYLNKASETLET